MSTLFLDNRVFEKKTFTREADFEKAIAEVSPILFGKRRIYLEVKHQIGKKGRKKNIPDGYLLDLISEKKPQLYVVENEIAAHDPLRHIAVQLLEFSFSFEQSKRTVKQIVYNELTKDKQAISLCEKYARDNGYRNVDHLLETIVFDGDFRALVIIDDTVVELESILKRKLGFPIEVIELFEFRDREGNKVYQFSPFLEDVIESIGAEKRGAASVDISEIDTVVVPARDDGFQEVFIGEDCWYKVRIHTSMISQIKYCAAYRTLPLSAITHVAPVKSIEPYQDTGKVIIYFSEPAKEIKPIKLVKGGKVNAPQNLRYTSYQKLMNAKNLDGVFN